MGADVSENYGCGPGHADSPENRIQTLEAQTRLAVELRELEVQDRHDKDDNEEVWLDDSDQDDGAEHVGKGGNCTDTISLRIAGPRRLHSLAIRRLSGRLLSAMSTSLDARLRI